MFVLQLNPMMGHYEQLTAVAAAESAEALQAFVESEKVEPYSDDDGANMCSGKLRKSFRKGGPLEFLNPPDRPECIVDVGTAEDWAERARKDFEEQVGALLRV